MEIYTEQYEPLPFAHDYPIYQCRLYRNRRLDWLCKTFWSLLTDWKNRYFSRWLKKAASGKKYDIVFCITFSTFPLRAAYEFAQLKHLPLYVDLRDIDEQAPDSQYQHHRQWWARPFRQWYRNTNIRRRNHILRQAHMLSSVSLWHITYLRRYNRNVHLIYNGFDAGMFFPVDVRTGTFEITYAGRLYEQRMQDPTLLFEALAGMQLPDDLRLHFYTSSEGQERIYKLAEHHGIDKRHLLLSPYVPPTEVPSLLHRSSILLVFSNTAGPAGPHGIMTTKFFEALGVEKPVLCVRSDEECLAEVIRETNAGLAATTAEEVQNFIREKYREWKQNGFTRQPVRQEQKQLFTRQHQARQFEELFLLLIESNPATDRSS